MDIIQKIDSVLKIMNEQGYFGIGRSSNAGGKGGHTGSSGPTTGGSPLMGIAVYTGTGGMPGEPGDKYLRHRKKGKKRMGKRGPMGNMGPGMFATSNDTRLAL